VGGGGGIEIMVCDVVVSDCDGMMVCLFNVEFVAHPTCLVTRSTEE